MALVRYPRALAQDAGVASKGEGFGGFPIIYNTRSKQEGEEVLAQVEAGGGQVIKPAAEALWSG